MFFQTCKNCGASHWSTLAEAYGIKVWFYWEHFGEHVENLMGTGWEPKFGHIGNRRKQRINKNPMAWAYICHFLWEGIEYKVTNKKKNQPTNPPPLGPSPTHFTTSDCTVANNAIRMPYVAYYSNLSHFKWYVSWVVSATWHKTRSGWSWLILLYNLDPLYLQCTRLPFWWTLPPLTPPTWRSIDVY